jgi:hypothetical protein
VHALCMRKRERGMKWWLCHFSRAVIIIHTSYSFAFGPTLNLHSFMGGARRGKRCQTGSYGAYGCISLDLRERQNNQGKKKVPRLQGVISHMPDRTQGHVLYLTRSLQVQDTRMAQGRTAHSLPRMEIACYGRLVSDDAPYPPPMMMSTADSAATRSIQCYTLVSCTWHSC